MSRSAESRGRRSRSALTGLVAGTGAAVLLLTGCASGDGGGSSESGSAGSFSVLTPAENSIIRDELATLGEGACSAENEAMPLDSQTVAQADVVQKITLLASQDALPTSFVAGTAQVRPDGDLGKNDLIVDYEEKLTELGVWDDVLPAARSTITSVYGGMVSLPFQYNVEGIWYNKQILAANGIAEPQTWDELVAALETLKAAGVVPLTEAGSQGWPLTRLIGNYLFRSIGPDAMKDIQSGDAKLTDAEYIEGAQAVADLGSAGLFGEGVTSRDTDTANAQFLTGEAAMTYNGSWFLANLNDPAQNQIGEENVGFLPFPNVTGGAGDSSQWPANAGAATATSTKAYDDGVGDWLTCIAENYGSSVLQNQGVISGFALNEEVTDVPPLTTTVQEYVNEADETVLWFEALFDAKTTSDAQTNVSLLVSGGMSAEDYMSALQADLDQAQ
ncbi:MULTISPECIES: extracellular solute-binding protein [unclassified Rathayibacter]|uniref:ABC transporter substrate-binding protein n=1 Tax=unclassified Rathayibacter TaxID=2609250 RepID=UPI0010E5B6DF|nr:MULTISPECIES: extracellular solute-binding protein [unclassified Rathayibacter]TCL85622.1 carbohydrate ABC transporter substrate-binding protein (CUT1 family) [Rathayibacter sp. PhB192]TCM31443.1 carbohydrate ABC transporter substrate-binding protein (CUT1 family) [Rathayibacter sp. PhB179]